MDSVNSATGPAPTPPAGYGPSYGAGSVPQSGLPSPTLEALDPSDPMGQLMAMLERMNELSTRQTERELKQAGEQMKEQLDKFLKLMADAIRRAQQAGKKKKKKGFFKKLSSSICNSVASAVGGTLGKALATVTMSPSLEKKIEGFTRGALQFSADLAAFNAKLAIALASDGPDFEKAWDDVKAEAKELWGSFQENCLENPDFMEIVGYVAKAAAVAGAIGSGGALAPVAIGIIVALEVDSRTNFIEDTFGEEAAPFIRGGLAVGAAVIVGSGDSGAAVKYLQAGTAVIQGASDVNAGIKMLEEGKRQARELNHQADLMETLNRMQQFQRLIDDLLAEMEDHAENKNRNRQLSTGIVEVQAATQEAMILRA
jgi:hypothetical protein